MRPVLSFRMAGNRSSSITDRLEDVLGGVEDEIRRAEERLHLNVFRGERTAAAGGASFARVGQTRLCRTLQETYACCVGMQRVVLVAVLSVWIVAARE